MEPKTRYHANLFGYKGSLPTDPDRWEQEVKEIRERLLKMARGWAEVYDVRITAEIITPPMCAGESDKDPAPPSWRLHALRTPE
jgi:hypothetical protein